LATAIKDRYDVIDVVFAQPYMANLLRKFLNHSKQQSTYNKIGFVDLSIDSTKPKTTKTMLISVGGRIEYIFDHHEGWGTMLDSMDAFLDYNILVEGKQIATSTADKHIVIGKTLCCAHLIYQYFNFSSLKDRYLDDLLTIAFLSDDLNMRSLHSRTEEYEIFKIFKNNSLEACLRQLKNCVDVRDISATNSNYNFILDEAELALSTGEEIYPGVVYLKTFPSPPFNYTAVCEKAYDDYKVVIIKELDPKKLRISYMVAHNIPGLDLVERFNLNGGNPRRVSIYKNCSVHDIVDVLKPAIDIHNKEVT